MVPILILLNPFFFSNFFEFLKISWKFFLKFLFLKTSSVNFVFSKIFYGFCTILVYFSDLKCTKKCLGVKCLKSASEMPSLILSSNLSLLWEELDCPQADNPFRQREISNYWVTNIKSRNNMNYSHTVIYTDAPHFIYVKNKSKLYAGTSYVGWIPWIFHFGFSRVNSLIFSFWIF